MTDYRCKLIGSSERKPCRHLQSHESNSRISQKNKSSEKERKGGEETNRSNRLKRTRKIRPEFEEGFFRCLENLTVYVREFAYLQNGSCAHRTKNVENLTAEFYALTFHALGDAG